MDVIERFLSRPTAKPYRSRALQSIEKPHTNRDGLFDFHDGDIENPKNWSARRRWYITAVSVLMVINATFASSGPSGTLGSISTKLHVSDEAAGLVISLFLLGYCGGPLFWAPLSESYGRRWIFYISSTLYLVFNFLCAFAPNFAALLVGRFITGTMASAPLSNAPGVLADIWAPVERGNVMALFSMMTFVGPAMAPVIGGFLQLKEDWRWIFYVLLWLAGLTEVLMFTVPETLGEIVLLNKARRLRRLNIPGYEDIKAPIEVTDRSLAAIFKVALTRPWKILVDPISLMVAIYLSVVYMLLYMLFSKNRKMGKGGTATMVYVRQQDLPNLKQYKYSGVDHSLLSRYVLKPFYTNVVIKCFPMWMAPNLITLTGFSFVVINILTLLWYNPTLDQDCPPWVYASWSIGLFLYQTFDAVDGSQARRTHQSGPLGELFDHGVDAVNTSLEVLIFAASQNLGMGWKTVLVLFGASLTFYIQTWDEYHTKTLTLGLVSGPVEGIVILTLVYAFTAIKGGASFWQQGMLETAGIPHYAFIPTYIYNLAFNEWYMVQGGSVLVLNTVQSAINVIKVRRERGDKSRGALLGLVPFFITWTLIPAYLWLNPEILYNHLVPFVFFAGLVNAYSVGQMITAHLVKLPFPYYNVLVLPIAYGVFDSLGPFLQKHIGIGWPSALGSGVYQVAYVFSMLGVATGVYGSFVVDVIVTICDYLDIWCLTIKHPWNEEEEAKKLK